jgi:DegV family protein with EDD domain
LKKVQVITDSTADLSPYLVEKLGIRVVPIYVRFGNKLYRDGVDITPEQFFTMLSSFKSHPATSQPNPEDFTKIYREYCDNNEGIVSIHVSSRLSGTCNSANMAKKTLESHCIIEVIDSKFNSAGLGLIVIAAARLAKAGAGLKEVVNEVHRAINEVRMFGMFETLKYLALSGRVNKTISSVSQLIHVMPLLTFRNGEVVRTGLVRTVSRGMERIYDYVSENVPLSELIIVHSCVEKEADELKTKLSRLISPKTISIVHLGSSLGVHGGPGVLLIAARKASVL